MRYRFIHYVNANEETVTVCVSKYAGKIVRGVAICSLSDEYDEVVGNRIAQARCDLKVAEKRLKRAQQKKLDAEKELRYHEMKLAKMDNYLHDAMAEKSLAESNLTTVESDYMFGYAD